MLSDITVARWLQCATNNMLRNNRTDIRCPCRRCKLECVTEPNSGILEKHMKRNGLMDGYTRWISDETGDQEEDLNVGCQKMRKGNQMKIKMLDIKIKMANMRIKQMANMRIKMPDMRINIPDIRIQAGCGTLMFKNCLSRRR